MPRTTHHPAKTREPCARQRGRCATCAGPMPHAHGRGHRAQGETCPGCTAAPNSPTMPLGRNAR